METPSYNFIYKFLILHVYILLYFIFLPLILPLANFMIRFTVPGVGDTLIGRAALAGLYRLGVGSRVDIDRVTGFDRVVRLVDRLPGSGRTVAVGPIVALRVVDVEARGEKARRNKYDREYLCTGTSYAHRIPLV